MVWSSLEPALKWFALGFLTSPCWDSVLWLVWDAVIRPRCIPAAAIRTLADEMNAMYGPRAEEMTMIEEDRAWRYSKAFEQGRWRRVRRELRLRRQAEEGNGSRRPRLPLRAPHATRTPDCGAFPWPLRAS